MREPAWKRHQVKKKWQSIVSVFIAVTLFFAIVNGLVKGFSFKNQLSRSKWDGKSSFTVAINTKNPSVFIYQPDSKKLAIFSVNANNLYETGSSNKPLRKIAEAMSSSGADFTLALSHAYGAKIGNYLNFKNPQEMDEKYSENLFVNFASFTTPIKLLTVGWDNNLESTNITRIDALKLWWQLKSVRPQDLNLADLSNYTQEILSEANQKVLGADTIYINRIISKYTENIKVTSENKKIKIINRADKSQAVNLAASFITSVGGNVVEVVASDSSYQKTQIITKDKKSYTALYLAKILDCDINGAQNSNDENNITVIIGSDFAMSYF